MTSRPWAVLAVVGAVALGAGVGIGAAVWAGGDHGGTAGDSGRISTSDHGGATTETLDEQTFLRQMVPHHESAVGMAELALESTERPEIRRLAGEIVSAQQDEIARMESWHREWFGEALVADTSGPHGAVDTGALEGLTGDEFDLAFLTMMIPHHASAITMAEAVMTDSPRDEVAALAEEIIAAQAAEIGQMQRWRERWFPGG